MKMQRSTKSPRFPRELMFGQAAQSLDHRRPQRRRFLDYLLSPGAVLAASLVGYYSLSSLTSQLFPDSSTGAILTRIALILHVVLTLLWTAGQSRTSIGLMLLPMSLFVTLYLLRLIENTFISDIYIPPGPEQIFPIFIMSCLVPAYALAYMARALQDEDFIPATVILCGAFLAGVLLNIDQLRDSSENRLMLDKINPISMAYTALPFLVFNLIFFRRSKFLLFTAAITTPILLFVLIYARSRGPYLAGLVSILLYLLLLKGSGRLQMLVGLGVLGLGLSWYSGAEYIEIITTLIERTYIVTDESTGLHYLAAIGAWQQFLDDFAFGRYAVELTTNFYPHNIYLESLMAVGLFGTLPFIGHIMLAGRAMIGLIRTPNTPLFVGFMVIMFMCSGISAALSGSIWGAGDFWALSCMMISLWYGKFKNQHHTVSLTSPHFIPNR